jgi:hypothetical protein
VSGRNTWVRAWMTAWLPTTTSGPHIRRNKHEKSAEELTSSWNGPVSVVDDVLVVAYKESPDHHITDHGVLYDVRLVIMDDRTGPRP